MSEERELIVESPSEGLRLDAFLAEKFREEYSRSRLQKMIKEGLVLVDGQKVSAHHTVRFGQAIKIIPFEIKPHDLPAEKMDLDIRFEDDDCLVVNKPAGLVVHPGAGNPDHTLVNALVYHYQQIKDVGDVDRPGIVHRLDKDTSGLMVIAKSLKAHEVLSRQFQEHTVEKMYWAIVSGVVQHDEFICKEPVGRSFLNKKKIKIKPAGGKWAETFFKKLERFEHASWLEVRPKTGRTHQIRVHLNHLDYPILGDKLYGKGSEVISRHALHAASLTFDHPVSGKRLSFNSAMPDDMEHLLKHLRGV